MNRCKKDSQCNIVGTNICCADCKDNTYCIRVCNKYNSECDMRYSETMKNIKLLKENKRIDICNGCGKRKELIISMQTKKKYIPMCIECFSEMIEELRPFYD